MPPHHRCGLLAAPSSRFYCKSVGLAAIFVLLFLLGLSSRGWRGEEKRAEEGRASIVGRHLLAINFSLPIADEIKECAEIHQLSDEQQNNGTILCEFVRNVPACQSDGGFIPYFEFVYCVMPVNLLPLSMVILFFWLLFLFLFLGTTAEEYFCPALTVISQILHLSQNVAGVTLLAFGNGAPDIFSALAAINQPDIKRASLAFGALFGAGMFVTTIVVGAVVISKPFMLTRRPYMRDLIFYLAAVYWTFFILWDNSMNIWLALGFICMYFCYVLVVIFGRLIYQKWKRKRTTGTGDIPRPVPKPDGQELHVGLSNSQTLPNGRHISDTADIKRDDVTPSPPPQDASPSPPPPPPQDEQSTVGYPTVIVVDVSDDTGASGNHRRVNIEQEGGHDDHHLLSSRERCASRASQHVYGISEEEDENKEEEHDRLHSPLPQRPSTPGDAPRKLRKTISGALDITEDVGLIAVGNPNLSKIWHHAYRKEIAHGEGSPRSGSPFLRGSPRSGSPFLRGSPLLVRQSPLGGASPARSRASSHLGISSSYRNDEPEDTEQLPSETENEDEPLLPPMTTEFAAPPTYHPFVKLLLALWPFGEAFQRLTIVGKVYETFKIPISLLLTLTVPVVDKDEDNDNWNRWLNILQCLTAPVFISLTTRAGLIMIGGVFPGVGVALMLGVALAVLIALTSSNDKPPRYHCVFAWLGFIVAVIWIYSIANEIVNLLQVFGIVIDISDGILGITLLAWGNSIGDAVANVTMARQGFPRMAIGACFGGPLLNMLLGIGIASTVKAIGQPGLSFGLYFTQVQMFAALFLLLSLSSSLIISSCLRFKMRRLYGVCLLVFYIIFLVVVILAEARVFDIQIPGVLEPV